MQSGPNGENPTGSVRWITTSGGTPSGRADHLIQVTCLSVSRNVATIGGSGIRIILGLELRVAGLIRVTDGGGPNSGQDSFEFATTIAEPTDPPIPGPIDCSSFPAGGPIFVNNGDLIVVDTPSLPTSKEQCKNGGWRNFPGFKNQGACVSFVATGGGNPPAVP